ncbi:MAG TPA: hypothetical protein ENN58_00855 [bacterium]|nr:hypothetical protein [bacterium]
MSRNIIVLFIVSIIFYVFSGCDSSTKRYLLEKPSAFSIQRGVLCVNGTVSYIGFVADDTKDYGARIKKISGCAVKIDQDFRDANDEKRGIFVGGNPVSLDQIEIGGEIYIATAVSGYVKYEKSIKAKGYKDTELPNHKGRLALRKLGTDLRHEGSYDTSIVLNYNPYQVKAFEKEGFFVTGSYFGNFYISYIPLEGEPVEGRLPFFPSEMQCSGEKCFLFNAEKGELYELYPEDLSIELKVSGYNVSPQKNRGVNLIGNDRFLIFDGDRVDVLGSDFMVEKSIELPTGFAVTSVSGVKYPDSFFYRAFTQDDMFRKINLFVADQKDDEEYSDNESSDDQFSDETVELNDEDDIESDEDSEDIYEDVFEEVIYDASEGDILWIASSAGKILAYDLSTDSWLVSSYEDISSSDVPDHYRELRPYISNKYKTYPPHGKTDASNSPEMIRVSSIRGLFRSVFYRFVFEGTIKGTDSVTGVYDSDTWLFSDENADFERKVIVGTDNIILRGKKSSSKCMIPWDENALLTIDSVLDSNTLEVSMDKYKEQIPDCYGEILSYSIFPQDRYSVTHEVGNIEMFSGRGREIPENEKEDDKKPSFSDGTISVWIRRSTDEVKTEKEFSYFLRLNPGIPYIGFSSNDVMERMEAPLNGKILMFSPLTRRFVEFDLIKGTVVKIYK